MSVEAHGRIADYVFITTYGKISPAEYTDDETPEGAVNFTIVICHYLPVAEFDLALDMSAAIVRM